jgi:hypothetical protein
MNGRPKPPKNEIRRGRERFGLGEAELVATTYSVTSKVAAGAHLSQLEPMRCARTGAEAAAAGRQQTTT